MYSQPVRQDPPTTAALRGGQRLSGKAGVVGSVGAVKKSRGQCCRLEFNVSVAACRVRRCCRRSPRSLTSRGRRLQAIARGPPRYVRVTRGKRYVRRQDSFTHGSGARPVGVEHQPGTRYRESAFCARLMRPCTGRIRSSSEGTFTFLAPAAGRSRTAEANAPSGLANYSRCPLPKRGLIRGRANTRRWTPTARPAR